MSSSRHLPPDVRHWIDQQDPAERDALARTWDLSALAVEESAEPTDAAWARLDALLDDNPAPGVGATQADAIQTGLRAWQRRGRPEAITAVVHSSFLARPAVWGSAIVATVVVIVAVMGLRPLTVTASGGVLALALPDGSEVTLAPGSEMAYRRGLWGDTRRVDLAGQAYFDVARDGRPFVVETFNASVEVLGTEFDVLAWPNARSGETTVALIEGSVRLRSSRGAVVLAPGETSRVTDGVPSAPAPIDVEAVTAWRDGSFSVVDASLSTVAAALEARFGRRVRLAPGVDADRRLTLFLPAADSADVVLRDLAAYLDLRIQVVADRYDVLPR